MRLSGSLRCVAEWTKKVSNLPEAYIKRAMEQVEYRNPRGIPGFRRAELKRKTKNFRFTSNRPWSDAFQQQNAPGTHRKKVFVEPVAEWSFFPGDRVQVLVGRDKGKIGIVSQVVQERNWVYVEGLNTHLRRVGANPSEKFPGVLVQSEAPLLVTNEVSLIDPSDDVPTQVKWRFTEEGDKVRVSARTGRILPMPKQAQETHDYKTKATYKESEKDTKAAEVAAVTFTPKLATFAMEMMQKLNIEEDRVPKKSYWY